jgi:hypothetical protein
MRIDFTPYCLLLMCCPSPTPHSWNRPHNWQRNTLRPAVKTRIKKFKAPRPTAAAAAQALLQQYPSGMESFWPLCVLHASK